MLPSDFQEKILLFTCCGNKNDCWNSVSGFRLGIYNFQLLGTGSRSGGIGFPITGYQLRVFQDFFLVPVPCYSKWIIFTNYRCQVGEL